MKKILDNKIIDDAPIESQMYYELLEHSRKSLNFLSQEVIDTLHPDLLYNLALQISPKASRKTIFDIMKQLHELETSQEKMRFSNRAENVARKLLLSRYY